MITLRQVLIELSVVIFFRKVMILGARIVKLYSPVLAQVAFSATAQSNVPGTMPPYFSVKHMSTLYIVLPFAFIRSSIIFHLGIH